MKHGEKKKTKRCSRDGCINQAKRGGVCVKHGAKVKRCSSVGCTNQAKRGGVCRRHGAYHNTQGESTAFGSEYEMTTATQTLPNQRDSSAATTEVEGIGVPREVTIICQEIVEV